MRVWLAILMALLIIGAACRANAAETTWCENTGIAAVIWDWLPVAAGFAESLGVDTSDMGAFLESDLGNFIGGLRSAAMTKDKGEVERYLRANGLATLIATMDDDDWRSIWTWCDRVAPIATSIFIRRGADGNLEGFGPRVAIYCFKRGDLDELSVSGLFAALPNLRFTPEEEEVGIEWLAQEIAIAVNMARE